MSSVASPWPPETRLPRVTSARLTRPSIGDTTFVNSRSSWAARRAAATASTCAVVSAAALARRSRSSSDIAFSAESRSARRISDAVRSRAAIGLGELGAQPVDLRLEGPGIDLKEQLALSHETAFLE